MYVCMCMCVCVCVCVYAYVFTFLTSFKTTRFDPNHRPPVPHPPPLLLAQSGKVHGSLSRAGKVKGQTPKVDKKEKKKAKTGRAKRRIQYNRRFVNVVTTFGKKRGPNSNS